MRGPRNTQLHPWRATRRGRRLTACPPPDHERASTESGRDERIRLGDDRCRALAPVGACARSFLRGNHRRPPRRGGRCTPIGLPAPLPGHTDGQSTRSYYGRVADPWIDPRPAGNVPVRRSPRAPPVSATVIRGHVSSRPNAPPSTPHEFTNPYCNSAGQPIHPTRISELLKPLTRSGWRLGLRPRHPASVVIDCDRRPLLHRGPHRRGELRPRSIGHVRAPPIRPRA